MGDPGCTLTQLVEQIVDARLRELGVTTTQADARSIRIRKGLSLTELSDRAGVSSGYVSMLERGRVKNIGSRNSQCIKRIADVLGVSAEEYRSALLARR